MTSMQGLEVGTHLKEVATKDAVYHNCSVVHSDLVGLVFEVQRTVNDGDEVESVVSHVLVPWANVNHVVLMEERS
jgi:hypothetical protein